MRVTFVSNFINHHQIPFSNALYERLSDRYCFIETEPMEEERKNMGWEESNLKYVHRLYEEEELCTDLIQNSDVVLAGWAPRGEKIIEERLLQGKVTFRISERIYREGRWKAVSPKGLISKYKEHVRFRNSSAYLLCSGAYVAGDFNLLGAYPNKKYKFGYFPPLRTYEEGELWSKKPDRIQIVFAGRFIPLKHAEYLLYLARDLKELKKDFHIHMIGSGELSDDLKRQTKEFRIEEFVSFYGFMEPEKVRDIMEQCHIHIFPSNHLEGWGAVVNEAMNSGCVPIGSLSAGAVPYLIEHGVNGLIYPKDNYDLLKAQVLYLFENPDKREQMAHCAYETIVTLWNAEYAAEQLLRMMEEALLGKNPTPSKEGPLSIAE